MTIGLVLSKTPGYSETFFISKLRGLQQHGFDVTVFAQHQDPDFSICDVRLAPSVPKNKVLQVLQLCYVVLGLVILSPKRFFTFVQLERNAKRSWIQLLKNLYTNSHILKADLDWVHFGFATIALQSEHVAKAIGAKMAVSFRGFDLDVYPKTHPNCYALVFKNVDKVHSISNYLLKQGYALGLQKPTPFQIITPAINTSKFIYEKIRPSQPLQFLTVGRLHWIKGLADSIKAMTYIKQKGIDFRYVIVGEGPLYDDLNTLIEQLNLNSHVFLEGRKPHDAIMDYMKASQVYIQYSVSEGFCNAVLEAQAMGCLCVVSDGGALPENVIHQETGWIVPKGQPQLLSERLLDLIALPVKEQKQIRQNAQDRVKKDFNLDLQSAQFAAFYESEN